jgi:hypothetical protein
MMAVSMSSFFALTPIKSAHIPADACSKAINLVRPLLFILCIKVVQFYLDTIFFHHNFAWSSFSGVR